MDRSGGAGDGRRRVLWAVLIAVLVVADVVLVAVALAATRSGEVRVASPMPSFSSTPSPEAVASETPTPTSTPSAASAEADAEPAAFLAAVDATEGWRATAGSCAREATTVERSTDAGATWTPAILPTDVRTVVALTASDERVTVVGGVGDACELQSWTSFTAGEFWRQDEAGVADATYLDPATKTVHLSSGPVPAPCEQPRRVTGGAVVCADGITAQEDGGSFATVRVTGLLDAYPTDVGYLVAIADAETCDGVVVAPVPGPLGTASVGPALGCAEDLDVTSGAALATAGGATWLWAGGVTAVSVDGGATW